MPDWHRPRFLDVQTGVIPRPNRSATRRRGAFQHALDQFAAGIAPLVGKVGTPLFLELVADTHGLGHRGLAGQTRRTASRRRVSPAICWRATRMNSPGSSWLMASTTRSLISGGSIS